LALPALQTFNTLIQIQNLKVRGLRLSSPLNACFDVLAGWRIAGLERCSCIRMHEHDPERIVIEHDNGFTMVNTREFELGTKPYVLPSQCEQVFYSEVPGKAGWSYFVRYDPRGRPVKYNHVA
jgi:hypothetical protein